MTAQYWRGMGNYSKPNSDLDREQRRTESQTESMHGVTVGYNHCPVCKHSRTSKAHKAKRGECSKIMQGWK